MTELFSIVVNLSITGSLVILAVMVIRLFLRRAPRIFSYILWMAVLFRLICPVAVQSRFGIVPDFPATETNSAYQAAEERAESAELPGDADTDVKEGSGGATGCFVNENSPADGPGFGFLPYDARTEIYTRNNLKLGFGKYTLEFSAKDLEVLAAFWLLTAVSLILYEAASCVSFMRELSGEEKIKQKAGRRSYRICISNAIKTPFTAGFWCPVIYLPEELKGGERELILEHEKVHVRRLDYLIKPLAFALCSIHWFNPLVWLSFYLMERDMELSCDEAVLRRVGYERKGEYAGTLLSMASGEGWKPGYPIAFGKSSVKDRIKNAVKLKRVSVCASVTAALTVGIAVLVLLTNRPVEETAAVEPLTVGQFYLTDQLSESGLSAAPKLPSVQLYPDKASEEEDFIYGPEDWEERTIANYDPSRDQFEVILLVDEKPHEDLAILYSYPVEGARISDDFGVRIHPATQEEKIHSGIDFAADKGTPVMAAAEGTVVKVGYDEGCGNYLILLHENGEMSYYTQCDELLKEEGDSAKRGEQIAVLGSTGRSTGPHLHFAVSRNGEFVRPEFEGSDNG